MDLNLTPNEQRFRDEFRGWLEPNAPPSWTGGGSTGGEDNGAYIEYLRDWQRRLYRHGWAGISWPKEYGGRGATLMEQAIFQTELARANTPPLIGTIGLSLVGPTIIAMGTTEQKVRYLPPILSGEEIWCQGFSEPNAGSDLAALGTKATRVGDDFIVNGQKIWTSFAQMADWCLLLVRTDSEAAKHKGITCLLVNMKSEGVSVRPLRQMSGDEGFNEVFFSNVRVTSSQVLGEINHGWTTAITALMNERANLGTGAQVVFKRNLNALIACAHTVERNGRPASADPLVRQKLAQAYLELEILRLNTNRALTSLSKTGIPGPEGSTQKLYWSEMNQRTQQIAQEILGPYGQLKDFDNGRWEYGYLRARGNTIEAGTSEIQRNIIAERVLGLPKELLSLMDFDLSKPQKLLKESAREFLARECPPARVRQLMATETAHDHKLWEAIADQGWTGLTVPEEHGGVGLGLVELAVVAEEMGRACLPGAFISTITAAALIERAASEAQRTRYLENIAAGKCKATVAVLEESANWESESIKLKATRVRDLFAISGKKLFVPDADAADLIVCVARNGDGLALLPVERITEGVEIKPMPAMDATRKVYEVAFENVTIAAADLLGADGDASGALDRALEVATVALCAEMVGGMQWILDTSVEYAKTRQQFGRVIGSFQAVQHQCADMLLLTESARSAAYYAAWALTENDPMAQLSVSMAKAYCSDAFREVANRGVQIHGGIGFTWEHDLQLYYKRSKSSETMFGDATLHRERIARLVVDAAGAAISEGP